MRRNQNPKVQNSKYTGSPTQDHNIKPGIKFYISMYFARKVRNSGKSPHNYFRNHQTAETAND